MVLARPDLSCRPNGESAGRRRWQVIQRQHPGRAMQQEQTSQCIAAPRCFLLCQSWQISWVCARGNTRIRGR